MVILLGYRGSGKTTVGRTVAAMLGIDFVDLDEQIVSHAGRSIREIFADAGEPAFRDIESECLKRCLKNHEIVLSLGGGAILRPDNRQAIIGTQSTRVYLQCDPATLVERIQGDAATAASRPALTQLGGGIDEIRMLLAQREAHYRQVSTMEIDVTHLSPEEVAGKIVREVKTLATGARS